MRELAKIGVRLFDRFAAAMQLATGIERPGVIALLFHHVFENEDEIAQNVVLPQERITLRQYRQIIEYFLGAGYRFVTPDDLEVGRSQDEKLAILTLDDGYANNLRILPLLREFDVPATIFVATHYIVNQRAFWWDVLYRNRTRQGATPDMIRAEEQPLMVARRDEVEAYLTREFGSDALAPVGDLDRPLTAEELRAVGEERLICIGNHTATHPRLSALNEEGMVTEFENSQAALVRLTGSTPCSMSYPYGDYSREVMNVAARLGFRVGVSCVPVKVPVPQSFGSPKALQIGRCQIMGDQAILPQCAQVRSDVSAYKLLKRRSLFDSF
jgi:peptidoglycan/xylan/chitin deacetylase (PgdA/CDA1 family)